MSEFVITETYTIGGLKVHVYSNATPLSGSVAAVFLLHGRHGSENDVVPFSKALLEKTKGQHRGLCVITLDHRNHGARVVEARANNTWTEVEENPHHAMDMYAIQIGTAQDISLVIDFLTMYLFPHGECKIDSWGVIGISLGGHSTWIALSQDPRITIGVPIIGCPDYLELMKYRAESNNIPFIAPYVPSSLLDLIGTSDPASRNYSSLEPSNPFLGKKILVLSGEDDKLVPWTASKKFVDSLEVGPQGLKKVIVEKGVGHKCTAEMVEAAGDFIKAEMINSV
ncbi:hypothetical protein GALMADRAFT_244822 [Galerina marginata CBS 339.88]|uniref:Peptidase S9 prolyl oligopeptidase catalytic domain-containing protein n=1 Tax=Galerina marginata (strain CBS 339.88) TaxID=685588 RepID=A0A067TGM7_GALM3|nr:hypothetical protein GALMADRAFT_244822 [Galerina marginata CBS 339.88]